MLGFGLSLGLTTFFSTNWRKLTTFSAYYDQSTMTTSLGNVTDWIDGTGNGNPFHVTSGTNPTTTTINGKQAISFGGAAYMTLQTAQSAVLTTTAGYVIVCVNIPTLQPIGGAVYNDPPIIADGGNWWGLGADSSNSGQSTLFVFDAAYRTTNVANSLQNGVTKVIEAWWDGTKLYNRVNKGATSSATCTGPGGQGGVALARDGTATNGTFNIVAMAFRKGVPTNQDAIASSMMAEYGAA